MNSETVTLIERPYQAIVDDILTAIVGGVVNEPSLFDVKVDRYPLAEPARDVRGITGTAIVSVNGETRSVEQYDFQKEIDFVFNPDDNVVVWQEGATWPKDDTLFYVDYYRRESRSPLTDLNVGSVTRTLSEAISREVATVYQQINRAYLSAFVDTATGKSLDLVVSILDITRLTKDYAIGQATFFREEGSRGNINIAEGTTLLAKKGEPVFRTTQPRTLQQGQVRINVPIRAGEAFKGQDGIVAAGEITELAQSIEGIDRVTNPEATYLGADDESDQDLRARAKAALRGLGKGTLAALKQAIAENRAKLVEVWDPNGPPDKPSEPGSVTLLVESEPEYFPGLRGAVHETRAAGIQATLLARYVFFKPHLAIKIKPDLTPAGKIKVKDEIIAALREYAESLKSGEPAGGEEMLKLIKEVEDVSDPEIRDVITWRSDVGRPGAETLVEAIMTALEGIPADDKEAQRTAITSAVTQLPSLLPSARRIFDRKLVVGPEGQPATDEQIMAGEFQVAAVVNGEEWWVVLDMEQTDILLEEKEA